MDKKHITQVAKDLIQKNGLINLSRRELCDMSGIPDGSFHHVVGCTFSEFIDEVSQSEEIPGDRKHPTVVYKRRVPAIMRKAQILDVAVEMSRNIGYYKLTRDNVANSANISFSLVTKYFGTMRKLKDEVMQIAIEREILSIILEGLVISDPIALAAPEELRKKASRTIYDDAEE